MNCAPGKIGTPSVASVGALSVAGRAGGAVGGAWGTGRPGCAGWGVPGRGKGWGVCDASRTLRQQRTPRATSPRADLCALCILGVLVTIMSEIISLRDFCRANRDWQLETTEALFFNESPTTDKAAVD